MDAFFLIDKPSGITSFDVLRDMRRTLAIKKLWHTGTLDPLATGGLLIATGHYTKLISYIDKERKTYHADIMLDGTSDSYDRDTNVCHISSAKQKKFSQELSWAYLEKIFQNHFLGNILQTPPKYSALKINGKRALERVRAGEEITMQARQTEIYSYKILDFHYPKLVVELEVQAWTYIRSIAHDLGQIIGSWGYISELRRTKVGELDISLSVSLDILTQDSSLDPREIFWDKIQVFSDEEIYKRLSDWQRVRWNFSFPQNTNIFLSDGNILRYVVEYKDGVIHPRKKICTP